MNAFQRELNNLQRRQQLLYILLFSFATVIVWIGVSLLTSQRRTGIPPEIQTLASPLNPAINTDVLVEMQGKRSYSDEELQSFPIYRIVVSRDGTPDQVIDISQPLSPDLSPIAAESATDFSQETETPPPEDPASEETTTDQPSAETPNVSLQDEALAPETIDEETAPNTNDTPGI